MLLSYPFYRQRNITEVTCPMSHKSMCGTDINSSRLGPESVLLTTVLNYISTFHYPILTPNPQ